MGSGAEDAGGEDSASAPRSDASAEPGVCGHAAGPEICFGRGAPVFRLRAGGTARLTAVRMASGRQRRNAMKFKYPRRGQGFGSRLTGDFLPRAGSLPAGLSG